MNNLLSMKKSQTILLTIVLALLILLSAARPARAQENWAAPGRKLPAAPSQPQGLRDPA